MRLTDRPPLFVMILAALAWVLPARAQMMPEQATGGTLLLRGTEPGRFVAAPLLGTDVAVTVSGPGARIQVTQRFTNPSDGWVEAVYVHPLPEDAAVDSLRMVVGDRVITGEIAAREEARRRYEQAREAGQAASLLEPERPNLFTTQVANIGPGESVVVQIGMQGTPKLVDGRYSLRVPLVVGPRFIPPGVADAARVSPPVRDPAADTRTNPVTLSVQLRPGFAPSEIVSPTHPIDIARIGPADAIVRLRDAASADRDFVLQWTPPAGTEPGIGLFREEVAGRPYILASVTPPAAERAHPAPPREAIFVIDNSGSMGGASMRQAKAGLLLALDRLRATDRFNVIRFDDTMDLLFRSPVPANAENLAKARSFVSALEARGGTRMAAPMTAALADHAPMPGEEPMLRQVVFLTDGAIANEEQLLDIIAQRRGRSRIFMVGIGSAPNSFLMSRAAELGRGSFLHIGNPAEVAERMATLAARLENPVLTNLTATFSASGAEASPSLLPDLYQGEPLVLTARLTRLEGTVTLRGMLGDRPWTATLPLDQAVPAEGLSRLWVRRRIADAEVARNLGEANQEDTDARIRTLALTHGLVTRLTSLVAVDRTPNRPEGARLTRAEVPLDLPHGWEFERVFGRQQGPLVPAATLGLRDGRQGPPAEAGEQTRGVDLPQTATDAELRLMLGALLLVLGGIFLLRRRVA
jgi:Ca-activated chloride channel family protein